MKIWSRSYSSAPLPEMLGAGGAGASPAGHAPASAAGSIATSRPGSGGGPVDAHVHIFPPEVVRRRKAYIAKDEWFGALYGTPQARMASADEVLAEMDSAGVEFSIVFGFAFKDQGLCRTVNDYVIESVARYPTRLAGLACVSPGVRGATAELERCLDAGLRGCGELMPDGQGLLVASGARVRQGFAAVARCLEERGLPVLIHANEPVGHAYPGKGRFVPEACFTLAQAYPATTIVFAHMGGGLFLYELMPEVRAALARVYYDTSAVPYLYGPEVYAVAATCAGQGKIIFGSDYPLLSPRRYLESMGGLEPEARAAALGETARKVFRL